MSAPAAPSKAPESPEKKEGEKKADVKVETKVADTAKDTHAKVAHAAPDAIVKTDDDEDYKRPTFLEFKPMPKAPSWETLGYGAAGLMTVVNPVGGLAIAGTAKAGLSIWGKAKKYPPFSWVNKAGEKVVSGVQKMGSSLVETANYVTKVVTTPVINTVKLAARPIHYLFERFIVDLPEDVLIILKQFFRLQDTAKEKISWPAVMGRILFSPIALGMKAVRGYAKLWYDKPIQTLIGTAATVAAMNYAGGPAAFAGNFADYILKILNAIANKLGAVPKVVPAIP